MTPTANDPIADLERGVGMTDGQLKKLAELVADALARRGLSGPGIAASGSEDQCDEAITGESMDRINMDSGGASPSLEAAEQRARLVMRALQRKPRPMPSSQPLATKRKASR